LVLISVRFLISDADLQSPYNGKSAPEVSRILGTGPNEYHAESS
jgi:hypothetical protein